MRTITDENLSDVLGSLGYTESFTVTDLKLGLGVLTVIVSGLLFMVEKKFSFNESYNITVMSLVVYFILSGILWYLTQSKSYKNVKYIGHDDSNNKITIATNTTKYDPIYNIEIRFGDNGKPVKTNIEFMKLFDTFTTFHPDNLKELIGKEIEKVSKKKQ